MAKWLVQRRLGGVSTRLKSLRAELAVVDEQLVHLADDADDLGIRALVADSPLAGRDHQEAARHAEAMAEHRAGILRSIAELEARQDALLDQLTA